MNRLISVLLIISLLVGSLACVVSASEIPTVTKYSTIEYLDNGDYIVTELVVDLPNAPSQEKVQETRATKTGSKTASYYNSAGSKIWSITVTGTFSYTSGSSSTATNSTATVNIYNSNAKFVSKNAYTSGSTATASGTVSFMATPTTKSVSVTCDKYGNLS